MIKRIAIVGPESTGKTTLSEQLAGHYQTSWVTEYAREYIGELKRKYTLEDIEVIAKKQIELEDEKEKTANKILFCDTNLVVCKVWAEHAFGKCPAWIPNLIKKRSYDLYLLTDIDLPWVEDNQREHPQLRKQLLDRYKNELVLLRVDYRMVSGTGPDRLKNALKVLKQEL